MKAQEAQPDDVFEHDGVLQYTVLGVDPRPEEVVVAVQYRDGGMDFRYFDVDQEVAFRRP